MYGIGQKRNMLLPRLFDNVSNGNSIDFPYISEVEVNNILAFFKIANSQILYVPSKHVFKVNSGSF